MKKAAEVGIREFRLHLKTWVAQGEPLVITKGRVKVAVLLPTGLGAWAQAKDEQAACARMKKMVTDQVTPAIFGSGW